MLCTNNFWSKGLLTYKWGSTKIGWWPGPCPSVHRSSLPPPLLTYQGKAWWNLFKCTIYNYQMEKAMAPHSSTLAWTMPWMEEPGRLQSMGSQRIGHDWATSLSLSLSCIGEGNGNPLQCSCLESPRDGGAWWAAVYGVTQSWTRLKWLSSIIPNTENVLTCLILFTIKGN